MKASKLSTRKRDLKTNHKDVLTAEEQKSSRGTTTVTEIVEEAMATGGNW